MIIYGVPDHDRKTFNIYIDRIGGSNLETFNLGTIKKLENFLLGKENIHSGFVLLFQKIYRNCIGKHYTSFGKSILRSKPSKYEKQKSVVITIYIFM